MSSNINDNIDTSLPAETSGTYVGKVLKTTFIAVLDALKGGLTTAKTEITGLQTSKLDLALLGAANGVASLGADSKLLSSQLPALAITSTYVVNSQAAQLALVAQEGDVAVRTDLNKSYIKNNGVSGTLADWTELLTPTDLVLSVGGKTGAIALSDLGLYPALIPSGDVTGAADYAGIMALHAALPATGGRIQLGAGKYYFGANVVTFTKPVRLEGMGSNNGYTTPNDQDGKKAITACYFNTSTTDGFVFTADGSSVALIHVENTSTTKATAGAAVVLARDYGGAVSYCSMLGFAYSVDVQVAGQYTLHGNKFMGASIADVRLDNQVNPDEGDCAITSNTFVCYGLNHDGLTALTKVGLLWLGGGGVKFIANKFNSGYSGANNTNFYYQHCIHLKPSRAINTVDWIISGCSLESFTTNGVFFDASGVTAGNGELNNLQIGINQFQGTNNCTAVRLKGNQFQRVGRVTVDDISCYSVQTGVAADDYVYGITVGKITGDVSMLTAMVFGATAGLANTATVKDIAYDLGEINVQASGTVELVRDYTCTHVNTGTVNNRKHSKLKTISREIPVLPAGATSGATSKALYSINVQPYNSIVVEATLNMNASGIGATTSIRKRALGAAPAANLSLATVGADFESTGATTNGIQFDVTSTSGVVILRLDKTFAADAGIGDLTVDIKGNPYIVSRL